MVNAALKANGKLTKQDSAGSARDESSPSAIVQFRTNFNKIPPTSASRMSRGGSADLRNPKAIVAFAHDTMVAAVSVSAALYLRLGDAVFALDPTTIFTITLCFVAIAGI